MRGRPWGDLRLPSRGAAPRTARRPAALLGSALLLLSLLTACGGEEPSTEAPDPGAPITRSPS